MVCLAINTSEITLERLLLIWTCKRLARLSPLINENEWGGGGVTEPHSPSFISTQHLFICRITTSFLHPCDFTIMNIWGQAMIDRFSLNFCLRQQQIHLQPDDSGAVLGAETCRHFNKSGFTSASCSLPWSVFTYPFLFFGPELNSLDGSVDVLWGWMWKAVIEYQRLRLHWTELLKYGRLQWIHTKIQAPKGQSQT